MFGSNEHVAMNIHGNVAEFSFADESVTPADLGPLVKIEKLPQP